MAQATIGQPAAAPAPPAYGFFEKADLPLGVEVVNDAPAAPVITKPPPKRKRPKREGAGAARKGKWTVEEFEYTTRLIELFNERLLELPEGVTLRAHLATKLNCDPMRITKKFSGASCLGNKVFHSAGARPRGDLPRPSPEQRSEASRELRVLEGRFRDACVRSNESTDVRMIDLEARFRNSDRVVSTPAIDAFIMQSFQPTWDPEGARQPPPLAEPRHLPPVPDGWAPLVHPSITRLPMPVSTPPGPSQVSQQASNDQVASQLLLGFVQSFHNRGNTSDLVDFVEGVNSRAAPRPPGP